MIEAAISIHPSHQELPGLVLGTLPQEDIDTIAEHIAGCGDCEAVVAELEKRPDEFVAVLRAPAEVDSVTADLVFQRTVVLLNSTVKA